MLKVSHCMSVIETLKYNFLLTIFKIKKGMNTKISLWYIALLVRITLCVTRLTG